MSNVCASTSWGILSPTIIANCLERGSSTLIIGLLTSIWALPFLVATPLYTRIVGRIPAKPALLAGMLLDVGAVWLFPLFPYDGAWIVLQLICGTALGHFSLVTEAWAQSVLERAHAGSDHVPIRILPALGYAMGAGIYSWVGYRGHAAFLAAAFAMALGIIPVLLVPRSAADIVLGRRGTSVPCVQARAVAADGRVSRGDPGDGSLEPHAGVRGGQSMVGASRRLRAARVLWRTGIADLSIGMAGRSSVPPQGVAGHECRGHRLHDGTGPARAVIGPMGGDILTGGVATATYTLGLAILGQRFDSRTLVSANAAFIVCYGIGAILGPPSVGALMDRLGAGALPATLGCASALIFVCASAARLEWRRREPASASP